MDSLNFGWEKVGRDSSTPTRAVVDKIHVQVSTEEKHTLRSQLAASMRLRDEDKLNAESFFKVRRHRSSLLVPH